MSYNYFFNKTNKGILNMNYMNYLIGEPITPYDRNSIKSIKIREKQYRKS